MKTFPFFFKIIIKEKKDIFFKKRDNANWSQLREATSFEITCILQKQNPITYTQNIFYRKENMT